jgi:hypothetical protein
MDFKSWSQAGQDLFIYKVIGKSGTFLDIGCNQPQNFNNTCSLEKAGWRGVCIDREDFSQEFKIRPSTTFMQLDLLNDDWFDKFKMKCPFDYTQPFDYLSFDIRNFH